MTITLEESFEKYFTNENKFTGTLIFMEENFVEDGHGKFPTAEFSNVPKDTVVIYNNLEYTIDLTQRQLKLHLI